MCIRDSGSGQVGQISGAALEGVVGIALGADPVELRQQGGPGAVSYTHLDVYKRQGLGVREAYEVVHRDQVLGGAMAYAARAMARKVGNALAAQGARPRESGAGDSPASRPARPEEFTDQQVLEVARQARKGRRITLNGGGRGNRGRGKEEGHERRPKDRFGPADVRRGGADHGAVGAGQRPVP